jgi:hypothetical protein
VAGFKSGKREAWFQLIILVYGTMLILACKIKQLRDFINADHVVMSSCFIIFAVLALLIELYPIIFQNNGDPNALSNYYFFVILLNYFVRAFGKRI